MSGALVAVNGTRLYCERAGGGPPLVMIHGDALDARLWDDHFAFFARDYEVADVVNELVAGFLASVV